MVFCGTFDTGGARTEVGSGVMRVTEHGRISKLVDKVDQITFSGPQSLLQGQKVIYITERAVFELRENGLHIIEIAPGIDLQTDLLDRMGFVPNMNSPLSEMDSNYFKK